MKPDRVMPELLPYLLADSHRQQGDGQLGPRLSRRGHPRSGGGRRAWRPQLRRGERQRRDGEREKQANGQRHVTKTHEV